MASIQSSLGVGKPWTQDNLASRTDYTFYQCPAHVPNVSQCYPSWTHWLSCQELDLNSQGVPVFLCQGLEPLIVLGTQQIPNLPPSP